MACTRVNKRWRRVFSSESVFYPQQRRPILCASVLRWEHSRRVFWDSIANSSTFSNATIQPFGILKARSIILIDDSRPNASALIVSDKNLSQVSNTNVPQRSPRFEQRSFIPSEGTRCHSTTSVAQTRVLCCKFHL